MFRAFVLSFFVLGITAWANYGYETLLAQIDNLVTNSYGSLAASPDPQLRATGQEITNDYFSYRQNH